VAGLASGGQYTFYVWAKVASGTKQVSIAIVDNAYAGYLAGPTSITLTTAWQRFKITGTLAGGQTGLWIVVRQFAGNGDNWTSGAIYLWGACLQQGNDPKSGYARTWASQTALVAAGVACGATVIAAKDNSESPLRIYGPGSNLADHRLLELTAGGELILAGGTGNGYRLAELMGQDAKTPPVEPAKTTDGSGDKTTANRPGRTRLSGPTPTASPRSRTRPTGCGRPEPWSNGIQPPGCRL